MGPGTGSVLCQVSLGPSHSHTGTRALSAQLLLLVPVFRKAPEPRGRGGWLQAWPTSWLGGEACTAYPTAVEWWRAARLLQRGLFWDWCFLWVFSLAQSWSPSAPVSHGLTAGQVLGPSLWPWVH